MRRITRFTPSAHGCDLLELSLRDRFRLLFGFRVQIGPLIIQPNYEDRRMNGGQ